MTNRFSSFNPSEKSILMLGLCKINVPENSEEDQARQKLLDEITK